MFGGFGGFTMNAAGQRPFTMGGMPAPATAQTKYTPADFNNKGMVNQMQQSFASQQAAAANPAKNMDGSVIGWMAQNNQNDLAASQNWMNQYGQFQHQQAAQHQQQLAAQKAAAAKAAAAKPAAAPAPAAQPAAPAPQQAAPNPLLSALQGSPMAQGQTATTAGALSRALTGGGGGSMMEDQASLVKKLQGLFQGGYTNG